MHKTQTMIFVRKVAQKLFFYPLLDVYITAAREKQMFVQ